MNEYVTKYNDFSKCFFNRPDTFSIGNLPACTVSLLQIFDLSIVSVNNKAKDVFIDVLGGNYF